MTRGLPLPRYIVKLALIPLFATVFVAVIPSPAMANDSGPRVAIVPAVVEDREELTSVLHRELGNALEAGEFAVVEMPDFPIQRPAMDARDPAGAGLSGVTVRRALEADVDYVILTELTGAGGRVTILAHVYAVDSAAYIAGATQPSIDDINFVEDARDAAASLVTDLQSAHAAAQEPRVDPQETLISLTFSGPDDGVTVTLGENEEAGTIRDGTLEAPFYPVDSGSTLRGQATRDGYHPYRFEIEAPDGPLEVELDRLNPAPRWEFSAHYRVQWRFSLGGGVRYYLEPGEVFVDGRTSIGVFPDFEARRASFHRFDFGVNIGTYLFFDPNSTIRTGLSTGGGVQPTLISDIGAGTTDTETQLFADPYVSITRAFAELNLGAFAPFLEFDLQYNIATPASGLESGPRLYTNVGVSLR